MRSVRFIGSGEAFDGGGRLQTCILVDIVATQTFSSSSSDPLRRVGSQSGPRSAKDEASKRQGPLLRCNGSAERPEERSDEGLIAHDVVGTGVDPVTFRFSGGRSAN